MDYRLDVDFGHAKRTYGLSKTEYLRRLDDQMYRCAICSSVFCNDNKPAVDHNHRTGNIRKLLCRKCNVGLGAFADAPAILIAAAKYLTDNG